MPLVEHADKRIGVISLVAEERAWIGIFEQRLRAGQVRRRSAGLGAARQQAARLGSVAVLCVVQLLEWTEKGYNRRARKGLP